MQRYQSNLGILCWIVWTQWLKQFQGANWHNLIILKLGCMDQRPRCGHMAYSLQDIWVKGCGYLVFIIPHHGEFDNIPPMSWLRYGNSSVAVGEVRGTWLKILVGSMFVVCSGEDVDPSQWLLNKFEDTWGLVLNAMHSSEGEVSGHIDLTSLVNLCAITLTNDAEVEKTC